MCRVSGIVQDPGTAMMKPELGAFEWKGLPNLKVAPRTFASWLLAMPLLSLRSSALDNAVLWP